LDLDQVDLDQVDLHSTMPRHQQQQQQAKKASSSKAAEKKRQRLAQEKLVNARVVIVNNANAMEDPLQLLPSFREFRKDKVHVTLTTERASDLSQNLKDELFGLLEENMKDMYTQCNWGWNAKNKREEMFEDNAWYMIARDASEDKNGHMLAFSHFRFDMDWDDEVLYVYEIQLKNEVRRRGLGKHMMRTLELLAFKADMRKIMLTVFKHNPGAKKFFGEALGYETDETSPVDDMVEQFDYDILSRFNRRKLAREESDTNAENDATKANV